MKYVPHSESNRIVREPNCKKGLEFRVGGTREGKSNGPFQHLVHPSSIKKHLSTRLKK